MERWSIERITAWYERLPWLCGFNYLPRTAVNWTEMWQRESFDAATIDQELGWAQDVGFRAIRTNLQFLVWAHDRDGLRDRLDRFLGIAFRRGMRVLLCLFDDCAFSGREPYLGPQDEPIPGLHNSGAAASPGREVVRDRARRPELERYVTDLVSHFRDDERLLAWDLYNEPGNEAVFTREVAPDPRGPLVEHSMALAEASFGWARAARPSQPLTTGTWNPAWPEHNRRLVAWSDVPSFHHYGGLEHLRRVVESLRREGRPLLCTEWLARGLGSMAATHLPYFRAERIGCFHWGLVNGRTQTHLPWPVVARRAKPGVWHHDLFHPDGTPYDRREIEIFRDQMGSGRSADVGGEASTVSTSPEVSLAVATPADATLLANLLELYLHDLSESFPIDVGADGRFGYELLPRYWTEAGRFAFLIRVGSRIAGFALVTRGSPASDAADVLDVAEFFVLRQHRRRGVGHAAAVQLWSRLAGRWIVRVSEGNRRALCFWPGVIRDFTSGAFTETRCPGSPNAWRVFAFESFPGAPTDSG